MSHHKHHMKAKEHRKAGGGATSMKGRDDYSGTGDPNVAKEARELKHGGRVAGHKGKHRIGKKRGGGIGADHSPFSSAAHGGMSDHPAHGGHGETHGHASTGVHAKSKKGFVAAHGKG